MFFLVINQPCYMRIPHFRPTKTWEGCRRKCGSLSSPSSTTFPSTPLETCADGGTTYYVGRYNMNKLAVCFSNCIQYIQGVPSARVFSLFGNECNKKGSYFNTVANDGRLIYSKIMVELKIMVIILCHNHAVMVNLSQIWIGIDCCRRSSPTMWSRS